MRPVVALTGSSFQSYFVKLAIRLAIALGGGKGVYISSETLVKTTRFDGLLLTGGVDVHPKWYNGSVKSHYRYDEARDRIEFALLERAYEQNLPILGICRGCQILNVFKKGSLYEDIKKLDETVNYPTNILGYIFFRKTILISPQSNLYQAMKRESSCVNSIHSQCINAVGEDLKVTAQEQNGVIQCIEDPNREFVVGLQFHPEFLIYKKSCFDIFKHFIDHCRS